MANSPLRSGLWFAVVGVAASVTHFAVYWVLTRYTVALSGYPQAANAAGFVVAFGVSFAGHRLLSFSDTSEPALTSLWRFVPTSLAGLLTNELVFSALLRIGAIPDTVALVAGMGAAAIQTYLISRFWVFKR